MKAADYIPGREYPMLGGLLTCIRKEQHTPEEIRVFSLAYDCTVYFYDPRTGLEHGCGAAGPL